MQILTPSCQSNHPSTRSQLNERHTGEYCLMLERIVYQSTASQEFGSLALFQLLTQAQLRNSQLQITGHLLFFNGQFTQCFEGPPESVEQLWQSIQRDKRHKNIELLVVTHRKRGASLSGLWRFRRPVLTTYMEPKDFSLLMSPASRL